MSSNVDPLDNFFQALRKGVLESVELEEGGALEIKKKEKDVEDNISAIGEILKAEIARRQLEPPKEIIEEESAAEEPEPSQPVTINQVENKILELGSILHAALVKGKTSQPITEDIVVEEPVKIYEPQPVFDEAEAKENIQNSFARIASLLKGELLPEESNEISDYAKPEVEPQAEEVESKVDKNDLISSYVDIINQLDKAKDQASVKIDGGKVESPIDQKVLDYINEQVTTLRIQIGRAMESGGGSVAQQFANGGTMNGNLNVTGQILSGGVDLATLFTGGGGGGGNAEVNSAVIAGSANWNSTYSTVCANSATWGTGGGNAAVNSTVITFSANWNNSYTTLTANSATWVTYTALNTASFVKYTDINTVSGTWNTAYTLATGLTSLSSNWQNTYTTVNTNSASWTITSTSNLTANSLSAGSFVTTKGLNITPVGSNPTTLGTNSFYIFTGSVALTANMPSISTTIGQTYFVKSKTTYTLLSATVTLSAAGSDNFFTYTLAKTQVLNPGDGYIIINDGSNWTIV